MAEFILLNLPPQVNFESPLILKSLASAHRYLAELKGLSHVMPNQGILINSLILQEAKDSSAIENIVTTYDMLYQAEIFPEGSLNASAKEVRDYASALRVGYDLVNGYNILSNNHILTIQQELEKNNAGFRRLPGTEIKNRQTDEVVYTPPQEFDRIQNFMSNLEAYINDDAIHDVDPLIKMAIIHFQFESIHPFYDGNGRTGRIINVLYLVLKNLLDIPILYLSHFIIHNRADYYRLLQAVRDDNDWEAWVLFMVRAVEETSKRTIQTVKQIRACFLDYKSRIRGNYRFYSQDLINVLFTHPYTMVSYLEKSLNISRPTATKYLETLVSGGFLEKKTVGRANYYINHALFSILVIND